MMTDVNDMERAEAYVADMVWRLEVLQSRSRYNVKTGELKRLPTRLRRFCNGIPQDNVATTLMVLESKAPYSGVVYNGEDDLDNEYRPTRTMIKKDQSLTTGADATYTIIQDLLLASEPDVYLAGDSSSCSQYTESRYFWDEADVMPCPDGEQGVAYQVAGVQRDSETDLFSFTLRKTMAVTQHLPPFTSVCDGKRTTYVETWDNVYGEPGDFRWDGYRHDGSPIVIPDACASETGDTVQVNVQENPDCTFKIVVERTVSRVRDGEEYMRFRDQYKIQAMDLVANARTGLSKEGVEYGKGLTTRYETKENDDGTFDNRITTEQERKVKNSTVTYTVMPYESKVEVVDTNMPSPADGLLDGYRFGSYEYTKTPGGLYVNKYVGVSPTELDLGLTCKKTRYLHEHSTEATVKDVPSGSSNVASASGGKINEVRYRVDGSGTTVRTIAYSQELEVKESTVESRITPRYKMKTVVDTQVGTGASSLPSGAKYGSWKRTITPGKLYTNEYVTFTVIPGAHVAADCSKTVYQHEHSTQSTLDAYSDTDVKDAGNGYTYTRTCSVDDNGVVTGTDKYVRELAVRKSVVETMLTPRFRIERWTDTNMESPASVPAAFGSSKSTVTPGGRYVNEYVKYVPVSSVFGKSRTRNVFMEEHVDEKVIDDAKSVPDHVVEASNGYVYKTQVHTDDNGVATEQDTMTRELRFNSANVSVQGTLRYKTKRVTHRHTPEVAAALDVMSVDVGESEERTTNPGRTTDVTTVSVVPNVGVNTGESCQETIGKHVHRSGEVVSGDEALPMSHVSSGEGRTTVEEVRLDDNGVAVKETTTTQELNHEYGSRVHEDAFQAYQVVERTSDVTNLGDPESIMPGFYSEGDSSDSGEASSIDDPTSIFTDKGTEIDASGGGDGNGGSDQTSTVRMTGKEEITVARVVREGGFARGRQIVRDSELTEGGRFHTKDYTYIPKPQHWYDHVQTSNYAMSKWTFRHHDQEQIDALVKDICQEAAKYIADGATVRPDINRTLNEFGLYDGTVSLTATVSSGGHFKSHNSGDAEVDATPVAKWWEKSVSVSPLSSLNPDQVAGERSWFQVVIVWNRYERGWGRGADSYARFVAAGSAGEGSGSFWTGSNHSYDFVSERYTYTILTDSVTKRYVVSGNTVTSDDWSCVMEDDNLWNLKEPAPPDSITNGVGKKDDGNGGNDGSGGKK